jgi:hypothetical protein
MLSKDNNVIDPSGRKSLNHQPTLRDDVHFVPKHATHTSSQSEGVPFLCIRTMPAAADMLLRAANPWS